MWTQEYVLPVWVLGVGWLTFEIGYKATEPFNASMTIDITNEHATGITFYGHRCVIPTQTLDNGWFMPITVSYFNIVLRTIGGRQQVLNIWLEMVQTNKLISYLLGWSWTFGKYSKCFSLDSFNFSIYSIKYKLKKG